MRKRVLVSMRLRPAVYRLLKELARARDTLGHVQDLSSQFQLFVGDAGVVNDCHHRDSRKNQPNDFAMASALIIGLTALGLGGRNLQFTDHMYLGGILLDAGFPACAYGGFLLRK